MGMRVFHLMMGRDGGTERFFLRLAAGFHEAGLTQEFAVRRDQVWLPELSRLGAVHQGRFLRRDPISLWQAWQMRRAMARFDPDVVMAWRGPVARLVPDWARVKVLRLGDYPFHTRYFRHLDVVVGNIPDIVTDIRAKGYQGRAEVISNFPPAPMAGDLPSALAARPRPKGGRVVAVGRFVGIKGYDILIRAMAHAPDTELWLIGEGPLEGDLRALAAELGLADRVLFLGWQVATEPFLRACDIAVLSSRDEAVGNVILEAWAAGLPVVSTRAQGPSWYGVDGQNMILVDIDDAQAMGQAIARLAHDPDLRAHLAKGGQATLAAQFSKSAVIGQYLALFDEILSQKGAA